MAAPTKLDLSVKLNLQVILHGKLLVVDPSSGSYGSMPGYALFENRELKDWGLIKLKAGTDLNRRLYHLSKTLRESFANPDLLVVENIPPIMPSKNRFFSRSIMPLQKAIGVTISCFDCPLVEVAPISWHKNCPPNYRKSDDNDAILMGYTVLAKALVLNGEKHPSFEDLKINTQVLQETNR